MIFAIVIFVLKMMDPSQEWLNQTYKNIIPESVEVLVNAGLVDKFDELGRLYKALMWMAMAIEAFIEFIAILKFVPFLIKNNWQKKKDSPIIQKQTIENIKYKLDNAIRLTKSENKFYKKYIRN